jgi:hypothetical protein
VPLRSGTIPDRASHPGDLLSADGLGDGDRICEVNYRVSLVRSSGAVTNFVLIRSFVHVEEWGVTPWARMSTRLRWLSYLKFVVLFFVSVSTGSSHHWSVSGCLYPTCPNPPKCGTATPHFKVIVRSHVCFKIYVAQ